MRLIDADELMEHAWRDKLDSRELIAGMIEKAPTIKEIPTKIPINVFEKLISQEQKVGHWINIINKDLHDYRTGNKLCFECSECRSHYTYKFSYCPSCGARMESEEV